jgi:hypothetical protein
MIFSDDKLGGPRQAPAPEAGAHTQCCATPGCTLAGEYRAPKSRHALREFHWFCLEHVRAYNASWDYYKGMSADEIEAETRADSSWQRPTWPLGRNGRAARLEEAVAAELHAFAFGHRPRPEPAPGTPPELREPLRVFGLVWPVTLEAVKARYKELAKRHHPDANQGDRQAEETLKTINLAYAALRGKLAPAPPPQAQAG